MDKLADLLSAARTRRLPEVKFNVLGRQLLSPIDFRFDQGALGTYPGIGPIPDKNTVIRTLSEPAALIVGQVNQPLSQLYRIRPNIKQINLGREIAWQQARAQQQAAVNRVKQMQTQSALLTTQETVKLYQQLDQVAGDRGTARF